MKPDMVCVDGHWYQFDDNGVVRLSAFPPAPHLSLMVCDFGTNVSGVVHQEGSVQHASALISRRLALEGATDSESKVLIHETQSTSDGYLALYSAAGPRNWQQMTHWSQAQLGRCLIVPFMSLLCRNMTATQAIVAQWGRQLIFLARMPERIVHCSVLAFSDALNDIEAAIDVLAQRVREELLIAGTRAGDISNTSVQAPSANIPQLTVRWHALWAVREHDWKESRETALAERFFSHAQINGTLAAHTIVPIHLDSTESSSEQQHHACIVSSLRGQGTHVGVALAVNRAAHKLSWIVGYLTTVWSAVFCVVAIVAMIYTVTKMVDVRHVNARANELNKSSLVMEQHAQILLAHAMMPPAYEAWSKQIQAQGAALERFDLNQILRDVGAAATKSNVRILRIYTVAQPVSEKREGKASQIRAAANQLVLDGAFSSELDPDRLRKLAQFVASLREAGYNLSPVDTLASRPDSSFLAQIFTYRLTPIERRPLTGDALKG